LYPAFWVVVDKTSIDMDGPPLRNLESTCSIKFRPHTLIEENAGTLGIVSELQHIEMVISALHKQRLRTSPKTADEA
jgi:hypothetical protein